MCAKIKHFFENLILAHKRYDKKVGFVGFLGIANSKKYRAMERRGYLLFFSIWIGVCLYVYTKGKRQRRQTAQPPQTRN